MTTSRKWRFPILIGSGLIAAGILVYFSNARQNSHNTQGAIGNRDVYRDGQVNGSDVAKPGEAPVATAAVLQSADFKSIANTAAFQSLLSDESFIKLRQDEMFARLLSDAAFQEMARQAAFQQLLKSEAFQKALAASNRQDMSKKLSDKGLADKQLKQLANKGGLRAESFRQDANFQELNKRKAFQDLMNNGAFLQLARNEAFVMLMTSESFSQLMSNNSFIRLLSQSAFRQELLNRSASELSSESHRK